MAHEIELKLALPESAQRTFLRHALLTQARSRHSERLVNIYYDTPDYALRKRGIALRLRRQGNIWLQTVKCAGKSVAGLTTRPEWEHPYGGHFDFSRVDADEVRAWLERPKLMRRIVPLFETSFQRTTWRFESAPGGTLLLMLDRGWIAAAGRQDVISELELELVDGDVAQVFVLAQALAARLPVAPSLLSKAERGYRLFRATPATPSKAVAVPLVEELPPTEAFRAIALSCLEHLQLNREGAVGSSDPEYIHQMRVATRRLRAALRLFAPLLPASLAEQLLPPLRELMARLGNARDHDVLFAEIAAPVMRSLSDEPRLAALTGIVTRRRAAARAAAVAALQAPAYGQLMLLAADLLHRPLPDPGGLSLNTFAAARLERLRRKARRLAKAARTDDPASLHALRIAIKRLRYALEFFAPLAPGRKLTKTAGVLAGLQDRLGQLNDLANAGRLLMECAGGDARLREAVTLIAGWHGPRHADLLAGVPAAVRSLRRCRLPCLGVTRA